MNNLRDITNNISGIELLDKKELDITWNYFNLLANSSEMLLFCLTKSSLIPMIDYMAPISKTDTRKVYENFGLREEQAQRLQDVNVELLNIQKALQIYCTQSYTLSMISSKFLSDLIDSIPEETNVQDIDAFMRTVESFKLNMETQNGGAMNDTFKKSFFINAFKLLILILLFTPNVQSSTNLELVTKDNVYDPYNSNVLAIANQGEFLQTLSNLDFKQNPVDITRTIVVYNREFKSKYDGLIGTLINYLNQIEPSAERYILNIVDSVNNDLRGISLGVETTCLELMKNAYDKGIFASWNSLDNIENTNKKIEEAKKQKEEQNSQSISNIATSTLSAATSAMTGDLSSARKYASSVGESFWDLLSSTKKTEEKFKEITTELQPTTKLTLEQKKRYENNLYTASKLYCSFGYNLQLSFDETTKSLNVVGDKIEHEWIVNLINVLEENLKVKITALTLELNDDESKNVELNLLVSTLQRLDILKAITNKLSDIINFSFKTHIMKVQIQPSKNTVNEIKNYFDNQLIELNSLLVKLNEFFPKRKEQIAEQKEMVEANIELKTLEQEVLDLKSNSENIIRARETERYVTDIASTWNATQSIFKSWIDIGGSSIELGGSALSTVFGGITRELTSAVGEIPRQFISANISLLNGILYNLISSPGGWVAVSIPSFFILLYFGQVLRFISVFTWAGNKFISITMGPFVFLYRIVKTQFGYYFIRVKTFLLGSANEGQGQPAQIEEPTEQLAHQEEPFNYNDDEYQSSYSLFKKSGGKRLTKSVRKHKRTRRASNKHKKKTKHHKKHNKHNKQTKHLVKKRRRTKNKYINKTSKK